MRALRDAEGDALALALFRIGLGLVFLDDVWRTTEWYGDHFGTTFNEAIAPAWLVPSAGGYEVALALQWIAGVCIVTGRFARPALLAAAALIIGTILWDRLWFHNYKHTMAAFAALLAFSPCDRRLVLGRSALEGAAPLWAQHAIKAQVSVMYLASSGSKLVDEDWRGGRMMLELVKGSSRTLLSHHVPRAVVDALQTPLGSSLLAKGALGTEVFLALGLWHPRTRKLALWVGLCFHAWIWLMTNVMLFTLVMLAVYFLFVTPDARARTLRFDPARHQGFANVVDSLDWLQRFRLEPETGARLAVVARDGAQLRGARAAAEIFGATLVLFPLWPIVAAASLLQRRAPVPTARPST